MSKLRYVGKAWIPGIPSRDLSAEETEKYGGVEYLIGTGLYEEIKPKVKKVDKPEVKDGRNKET